jgi:sugar phosphate permease
MDFGGTKAAASVAGLFDAITYLSSAFMTLFLGRMIDVHGWKIWTYALIPFSLGGMFLTAIQWNLTTKNMKMRWRF